LIPYFGNEFLLNNVWKFANRQKTNVEIIDKTSKMEGLTYTLQSIQQLNYNSNTIIILKKGSQLPSDSIDGFSRYFPLLTPVA
ncbi:MAG: hypothetical protein RJA90_1865, partial [Bacteroidota bacterium]